MALERADLDAIRAEVNEALDDANVSDVRELAFQVDRLGRDFDRLARYVRDLGAMLRSALGEGG